jgi:glycine/D-amino acid oxidase-like deaminating enzyme
MLWYSFSIEGFMHAPMAARLLTELILDGASTTFPIDQFRFVRCLRQRTKRKKKGFCV